MDTKDSVYVDMFIEKDEMLQFYNECESLGFSVINILLNLSNIFFIFLETFYMSSFQGTQLYDPKAGGFRDLGMLDVMQV